MKRILFAVLLVACGGGSKATPPANPQPEPAPVEPAPVAQEPTPAPAPPEPAAPPPPPAPKEASVTLAPTAKFKSKVKGTIAFKEVEGGVEVTANVEGLKAGDHAWHIHEKGDCSAPDGTSAGDHFNPDGHKHGAPDAADRHAGDFGNLTANKQGMATKTFTMKGITIADGPSSIVGKGFIIHEKKDDLRTQPSGNAGNRLACGVIEVAGGAAAAKP